jgi:hypothetical protein
VIRKIDKIKGNVEEEKKKKKKRHSLGWGTEESRI